tara:strand:- start:188 stop:340 length:153 start_codon:yes stop_codon:yes gene_type:complete
MKHISKIKYIVVSDNNGKDYFVANKIILNQVKEILNNKKKLDVVAIEIKK